jgi:hypothetical protein
MDEAARQLALVLKAIREGHSTSVEWVNDAAARRVYRIGWTPNGIIDLLIEWVRDLSQPVEQRRETRERWRDEHDFWYCVNVPVDGQARPMFIEFVLREPCDEDLPEIVIVNAHPTSFP